MTTQLDPVTGAPLLTPDLGNIDQLPYKVQPVPLADQTNQPQLGRTYLYPDDVPPVLANINAMNGTQTDQAQTLHTDGNHRLLVASSGGGGTPAPTITGGMGDIPLSSSDIDDWEQIPEWAAMSTILSMDFFAFATGALDTGAWPVVFFELADGNGNTGKGFFARVVLGNGQSGMTTGLPYGQYHVDFGSGLDVGTYLGTNTPGFWVHAFNRVNPIRYAVTAYGL